MMFGLLWPISKWSKNMSLDEVHLNLVMSALLNKSNFWP